MTKEKMKNEIIIIGAGAEYVHGEAHLAKSLIKEAGTLKSEDFLKVWFDFKGKTIKPDELITRQIITVYK